MRTSKVAFMALAASSLFSMTALQAFAETNVAQSSAGQPNAEQKLVQQDFGKLSRDGIGAIRDIRLARLAIFGANTALAKTDIEKAQAAIDKAKTADTSFMKAETDLKPPPGAPPVSPTASHTSERWIPVDGALSVADDYKEVPTKVAGVAKANEFLKSGDKKHALEALRLAKIDADFVMAVAPLDRTTSGIDKAAQLIDSGHYFEANATMKGIEDSLRFDSVNVVGVPKNVASADTSNPDKSAKSGSDEHAVKNE